MRDVLDDVSRWRAAGKQVALATVVSVVGSAPRTVGATLAVSEEGEISGSVSGGCVEPAVIEEGLRTIRTGAPKLLTFGITEEQNVEQIGLSCGGEIRVFVERLDEVHEQALQAIRERRPAFLATIIDGTQPDLIGRKVLMDQRDVVAGSLGEPMLEGMALIDVDESVEQGTPRMRRHTYDADQVEMFISAHVPPPTLVAIGAGHITIPLTRLAKTLGYHVVVIDAREAFATRERLPDADELLVEWPDEAMAKLPISSATAVAVLTHDDKFDVPALVAATRAGAGYIGAIGSRGTRERRNARLRESGLTEDEIARIHGPIGLDIGAKTPEEIALAILAQLVAVRRGRAG